MSPDTPVPAASNVSSGETGDRASQFVPGLSHCKGVQGQRKRSQVRGLRRGGRSRPQQGRAAPITEHLDKLCLSSVCTEGPITAKPRGTDLRQAGKDVYAEKQERPVSAAEPVHSADLESLKDAAGGLDHRGRRRGPYRSAPHTGAPGSAHYHWDDRVTRSRGGSRRGHGRGFQQKAVARERGREEVL